jgi:hypothetical protein
MMTTAEFNKMTLEKQADFVLEWGYYIGSKKKGETNVIIYYLGNFLAEVSYLVCETENIKTLKTVELKKYLSKFDYKNIFFIKTLTGIQSKYRVR